MTSMAVVDVPGSVIRVVASLPDHLPGSRGAGLYAEAIPGKFLLKIPGVARYLVSHGNLIDIAPERHADESDVQTFLAGAAHTALIHQRGELPLHAAAIVPPSGHAIVICGASGTGKSTLAAEFSRRGWFLLADDMSRVTWDGQAATASPECAFVKLWPDALKRAGLDATAFRRLRDNLEKYYVPVAHCPKPMPIEMIVSLTPERCGIEEIQGVARFAVLSGNTRHPHQIEPLGKMHDHMRIVQRVANAVKVFRLGGARGEPVAELADRILRVMP
jgi:hypothetical protein